MRDDIETLLRDAGHGPTRDLDVDQVHATGQRRARTRNVATGIGALALLGVVAVGVNVLLPDTPDAPIVDQGPSEQEPVPGDGTPGDVPRDETDDDAATMPTGVGGPLARVELVDGTVQVTVTAPDGTTASYSTSSAPLLETSAAVVVDGAGRVVYVDEAGGLIRADASSTAVVRSADEGPWAVLGTTSDGDVLVARGEEFDDEVVLVLTDTDLVMPDALPIVTNPSQELTVTAPQEERFGRATAGAGRLVAEMGVGDSLRWVEAVDGGVAAIYESATMPFVTWRTTPTIVDGELWAIERQAQDPADGPDESAPLQDLVVRAGEDDEVVLPTPVGREVDGYVQDITTGSLPDGSPGVLLTVATDEGFVTLLVDVERARSGDADAVTRLDVAGDVRFLAG